MKHKALLNEAPFLRFVIPLMMGIGLRLFRSLPFTPVFCAFIITLFTSFCFTIIKELSINYRFRWIGGVAISLAIFCIGIILTGKKLESIASNLNTNNQTVTIIGIISQPIQDKSKSVQCLLRIDRIMEPTRYTKCNDKILVYLQKDPASLALKAGDLMVAKVRLQSIQNAGNPYEFDYKQYMSLIGIHFTGYVNSQSWKRLSEGHINFLQKLAFDTNQKLFSIFRGLGLQGKELGVASALIYGDTSNLDHEIKQAYIASGTMHILAVSGMHVALLFWVLSLLLSFLDRIKHGRYYKIVLLILAIWFYALITGLGGSILRAATMITFVVVGQSMNRNINIFNSLAASAFLLLLINPFNLINVGFQLSYFAVFSIVIFHPLIYKQINIKSWFGNHCWELISVTIAAQLITTPISLFYFHQFPNLFIVSNLLMIPLSTIIMYFAMVLIPLSGWPWLAAIMGKIFNSLVWLLNKVVLTIEGLPFALTKGIYINWLDVCMLYLLICFTTLFLIQRKSMYLVWSLAIFVILLSHSFVVTYQKYTDKEIVFYNDNKNTIIQFYSYHQSTWLVKIKDEQLYNYIKLAKFAMHSGNNQIYLLDSVINMTKKKGLMISQNLWIHGSFIQFFNKSMMIPQNIELSKSMPSTINLDYLVFHNEKGNFHFNAGNGLSPKLAVFTPDFKGYKSAQMEKLLTGQRIKVYHIGNSGALRIIL